MKSFKILAILFSAFILFGLTSCDSCSGKKQPADTHVHDDGSVHGEHADEPKTPVAQENFKADSTQKATPAAKEEKHDDHGHDHSDPNHKH
jgi:hypothetical protein